MALSAKSTIIIEGVDGTGRAFKSAEQGAQGLAKKLESFADKSGDGERALLGVKDILGSMGGPAQELADWAGGFEGIVKGIGGPLSIAVAGAAALAAGFYQLWQTAKEAEKARADALVAQHNTWLESKQSLAEYMGLERDALESSKERLTADQLHTKLLEVSAQYQKESGERIRALATHDKERVATADQLLGKLREQAAQLASQEQFARRIAETEKVRAALQQAGNDAAELERQRIERIADVPERLARLESLRMERERKLAEDRARLREQEAAGMNRLVQKYRDASGVVLSASAEETKKIEEYTREKTRLAREEMAIEDELMRIAKAGEQYASERQAERDKRTAAGRAAAAERKRQLEELARAEDQYTKAFVDATMRRFRAVLDENEFQRKSAEKKRELLEDAQQRILRAQSSMADDPAEKDALDRQAAWLKDQQDRAEIMRRIDVDEQTRKELMRAKDMEWAAFERDESRRKEDRAKQEAEARNGAALSIAQTGIDTLEKLGLAERAAAGLKAAVAAAESGLAFAKQDYAGAAAGAFAAIQFAAIAAGGGGSAGGGAQAGSSGGGGQTQFGGTPMPESGSGAGGGNVSINFGRGFVVGTPQQVGKAVGGALRSINGTGFAKKQAA